MAPVDKPHRRRVAKMMKPEDYEAAWRARQNWVSPWKLVRENRIEEAIELHKPGMGQVLMYTGQYELAAHQFEELIGIPEKRPLRSEDQYAFLGAARWCLQDYSWAFRYWRSGADAPYASAGICIRTPLLLFAGSLLHPEFYARAEAEELLRAKLSSSRGKARMEHWPACLGRLALGTIPKEAMAAWWVRTTSLYEAVQEHHRQWITEFYDTVLDLGCLEFTLQDFRASMRRRTQQPRFSDWDLDQWECLMRSPEFYIARFEGSLGGD